ncbi:hypothetical protein HK099_004110 [Clydaea vesicula]|uniref:Uncharacterized protein n=1 Tax=Clydaea vesicula TaxID=447962 RepID=A0AAD5XVV2_9FUNG|nr:hypothetical protein HK099_004110 [Clydaea vesicula]
MATEFFSSSEFSLELVFYFSISLFFVIALFVGNYNENETKELTKNNFFSILKRFFGCGLRAGLFYTLTPFGALKGMVGVFSYSVAIIVPNLILIIMAPTIRNKFPNGFSLNDFIAERYGNFPQFITNSIRLFYISIYLITELSALGYILSFYGINALPAQTIVIVYTTIYTILGRNTSSYTDKFQGIAVLMLLFVAAGSLFFRNTVKTDSDPIEIAPLDHIQSLFTLVLAVIGATVQHEHYENVIFFIVYSKAMQLNLINLELDPFAQGALFAVIRGLPTWINFVIFVLVAAFISSSIDSQQTSLTNLLTEEVPGVGRMNYALAKLITCVINLFALYFASTQQNVIAILQWFLIADLITCFITFPVLIGFLPYWEKKINGFDFTIAVLSGFLCVWAFGVSEYGNLKNALLIFTIPDGLLKPYTAASVYFIAVTSSFLTLIISSVTRRTMLRSLGYLEIAKKRD